MGHIQYAKGCFSQDCTWCPLELQSYTALFLLQPGNLVDETGQFHIMQTPYHSPEDFYFYQISHRF